MQNLITIKTLRELKELPAKLETAEFIAVDTETTGVARDSEIIGFSVCGDTDTAYYVILAAWNKGTQRLDYLETKEWAVRFFAWLIGRKLVMHNAVFDCSMIDTNFGINLINSVHTDTMILAHLLDENRPVGLKELGVVLYGEDAKAEQAAMKESVKQNGGLLTKEKYEMYKADADLMALYGAKDAILTLKLFYSLVPDLYEQGLDQFFYDDESMPLLRGPTYDLNTTGLKVDPVRVSQLKTTLETECLELKSYIYKEIIPLIADKYPGTSKKTQFNIGSSKQLAWLLFVRLGQEFKTLTDEGRNLCQALDMRLPYSFKNKREFICVITENKGRVYAEAAYSTKTKKLSRPKKVGDVWNYLACSKEVLTKLSKKYLWVEKYLQYTKNMKLLSTYIEALQEKTQYGIIRPSFLQHGTTSGRYSSRQPNFQNLPRDDKRIKSCIVSRAGKVFVGADYSQLEPRVFASLSGDERLLKCFEDGDDFYSVIGVEVFDKHGLSLKKDDTNSFAKKHPDLRNISKVVALSSTYGTTAAKMSGAINKEINEAQEIIDNYFERFPKVKAFMLKCHDEAKTKGQVLNLYGRPRRMMGAKDIVKLYGKSAHSELPYTARNTLNLAVNHVVQSTGASIMNRASIMAYKLYKELPNTHIVMQVHDEVIIETPEEYADTVVALLKYSMETAVTLPGVKLIAEPKIAKDLAGLK